MSDNIDPILPPPGWYPDPAGSRALRWWSGTGWTADLAPLDGTSEPARPAASPPEPVETAPPTEPVETAPISAVVDAGRVSYPATGPLDVHGDAGARPLTPAEADAWLAVAHRPRRAHIDSPHTVGAWLIAALPGLVAGLGVAALVLLPRSSWPRVALTGALWPPVTIAGGEPLVIAGLASALVLWVVLVIADRLQLRRNRLIGPGLGWILLPLPLVYLIARRVTLRRQGVRSDGPWIVTLVLTLLVAALVAVVTAFPRLIYGETTSAVAAVPAETVASAAAGISQ